MDFMTAVKACLTKFADFSGRSARPEFWWFFLAQCVAMLVASFIHLYIYGLVALAVLVLSAAVGARRLHDIGKSGWLLGLGLTVVGGLVLIYFFVQPGEPGDNAYGSPPVA